ncbi:hypothetical protein [Bartonella sp. OT172YNZD]|uniref:hypothetical protein n=1 Tax=Bartonella sp. OT172YNZD TaxID=3243572 RepID=UPI0035CEBBB6
MGAFLAAFIKIPRLEFILPALMLSVADLISAPHNRPIWLWFVAFYWLFNESHAN